MIDRIVDNVFVSGAGPVLADWGKERIEKLGITHVLTISAMGVPSEKRVPDVDYKFIFALDVPHQDITNRLEEGVQYIEEAVRNKEGILVHCEAGMSRSVAFVCAYLMRRFKWNVSQALVFICKYRSSAQPNSGFIEQLSIFESLGYAADSRRLCNSQKYRMWCMATNNRPQPDMALTLPETSVPQEESSSGGRGNKFRCGKCRQAVFFGEHLLQHNRIDGEKCTFGYLIEPMKWMKTDEYQGKVCCPSCGDKLGNYSWGGRQCQGENGYKCCEQVLPWVHLHKNKVDEVTPRVPIQNIQRIDVPAVIITQ